MTLRKLLPIDQAAFFKTFCGIAKIVQDRQSTMKSLRIKQSRSTYQEKHFGGQYYDITRIDTMMISIYSGIT
jgi:hypothetical protein